MRETPDVPPAPNQARDANERGNETGESGESTPGLSIEELAQAASLPVRTIRYYIAEGLLPGPGSRGKQAAYGEEQLARLQLIRRLAARYVPLAQMRKLLAPLRLDEVRALLAEEEQRAAALERAQQSASPKEYVAGLLQRARALREPPIAADSFAQTHAGYEQFAAPKGGSDFAPSMLPARVSEAQRKPSSGPYFRQSPPGPPGPPGVSLQPAEAWQRWELAPGVELQVRAEAARRYRDLIRRVLEAAREAQEEI